MSKSFVLTYTEYYRIMKAKMKISYEALLHGQTIKEFFINAILKVQNELMQHKDDKILNDDYLEWRKIFQDYKLKEEDKVIITQQIVQSEKETLKTYDENIEEEAENCDPN